MANTLKFGNGEWYGKKDTILAYNDLNSNYKPLPFNFSRASKATVVNKDGLIEEVGSGEPRVDYKDDSNGALLLEPQRTNKITLSNGFNDTSWVKSNSFVSINHLGVGGSTDAVKLNSTATGGQISKSISSNGNQTFSIYAKADTLNFLRLRISGSANPACFFDLVNGTIHNNDGTSASMNSVGDGWYRCQYTLTSNATTAYIIPADTSGTVLSSGGSIYIQYAQVEEGSYATSYIPTQGGSAVTRLADECSQTPPSGVIGQTEGTMFIDIDIDNNSSDFVNFFLWNGSTSNRVFIQRRGNNKFIQCQMSKTGETTVDFSGNTIIGIGRHKMAVSYSNSRLVAYIDGNKIGEQNTGFSYTNELTKIGLTENPALRILKEIKLYDNSMTDQELIALTS